MAREHKCNDCGKTGSENFYKNNRYQCKVCWNIRTFQASRKNLDTLIEERGAKCEKCGYQRCYEALQWHHINPSEKEFGISSRRGAPLATLRIEVAKCKLLCANCHAETHAGII